MTPVFSEQNKRDTFPGVLLGTLEAFRAKVTGIYDPNTSFVAWEWLHSRTVKEIPVRPQVS